MTIDDSFDFVAAVGQRERLRQQLAEGRKQFQGYALELFERGMNFRVKELNKALEEYEALIGYTALVPSAFWVDQFVKDEAALGGASSLKPPDVQWALVTGPSNSETILQSFLPAKIHQQLRLFLTNGTSAPESRITFGNVMRPTGLACSPSS